MHTWWIRTPTDWTVVVRRDPSGEFDKHVRARAE